MIIKFEKIDKLFANVWLAIQRENGLVNSDLELKKCRNNYLIQNENILEAMMADYELFFKSDKNLDEYFKRSVIIFKKTRSGRDYITQTTEAKRRPLILLKNRRDNFEIQDINFLKLKSAAPIKMNLRYIASIYDIQTKFKDLTFLLFLQKRYQIVIAVLIYSFHKFFQVFPKF